jgi:hypothetical protein
MKKICLFLFFTILMVETSLFGQAEEQPLSRVQWLNSTCAEPVEFVLNGTTLSSAWSPGQRIGAGNFPALQWSALFKQADPIQIIREEIALKNGDSLAAVLIGDFQETPDIELVQGKLPRGYSLNSDRKIVRAGIAKIPIIKGKANSYPVYVLNGIPEETVRVGTPGGKVFELGYGDLEYFMASPNTFPEIVLPGMTLPLFLELMATIPAKPPKRAIKTS